MTGPAGSVDQTRAAGETRIGLTGIGERALTRNGDERIQRLAQALDTREQVAGELDAGKASCRETRRDFGDRERVHYSMTFGTR